MFGRQKSRSSLQPNAPLSKEEPMDKTSIMSGGSSDASGEQPRRHRPATMLEVINEKVRSKPAEQLQCTNGNQRTELQLFGSEHNMSAIQDLNNLLYTRERLLGLGCTFTTDGELSTFGDPTKLQQFEQLLRLGPVYDEQWRTLFNKSQTPASKDEAVMWSDLRTLKRVMTNESVAFGPDHERLNHGTGSSKLFRLCAGYDDLHKLWSASIPAHILTPIPEHEQDDTVDDSGCYMDEDGDGLAVGVAEMPVEAPGLAESVDEMLMQTHTRGNLNDSKVSLPRNIGWRFSDDYTPNAQDRDSMSDDDLAELEADVVAAVAAQRSSRPFPVDENECRREKMSLLGFPSATFRNSGTSAFKNRLRHGPSPLQVSCGCKHKASSEQLTDAQDVATASLEPSVEPKSGFHVHNTSLGSEDSMNSTTYSKSGLRKSADGNGNGKKGRKGWWRGIFGRNSDPTGTEKPGPVGGWW